MAGIGFRIEKILSGDTYLDTIKAHFYSAVIFSGPWILSILTLFCLGYFSPSNISVQELLVFRTSIVYVFAFSLIGVGFLHLSVTRYLSDNLYIKDEEALIPIFNSSIVLTCVLQSVVAIVYLSIVDFEIYNKVLLYMIFLVVSILWVVMIFLTALRDYFAITMGFIVGSIVTVIASYFLGKGYGLGGYFLGYLMGHLLIVTMLSLRIFIEFPSQRIFDRNILFYLNKYKVLVLTGVFYNLAIWIDKIVFWCSDRSFKIMEHMYSFSQYESATFFAYLSIIPSLTIFLIHIETDFYKKYNNYYSQILNKGTMRRILEEKEIMTKSLRNSFIFVTILQGFVSVLAIIWSAQLCEIFQLSSIQIPTFRLAIIGSYLYSLLLIVILVILYFDFQYVALVVSGVFMMSNGLLTYGTTFLPLPFVGYGYLFSSLIALALAYYWLDFKLKRLEFLTFSSQPVGIHREEEIA